ncbi:MAG: thioredoxin domain-containing protein, partial [Terriglobales bacterium]
MASDRLASATSPYLRQHAANPVDWYAWGEEAFARARERDCPIFLSVGYFTCHWCHVMERESFASAELAAQLNRDFVSIKLDREERPDIDRLYMSYVQSSTGAGGWPMSVFLTPDLKPFYGGTYFPPQPRHGLPGFRQLLAVLAQAWRDERPRLLQAAEHARQFLAQASAPAPAAPVGDADEAVAARLVRNVWPRLWRELRDGFDAHEGGFGGAPKFPRPAALGFLLRYARFHPHDADEATVMVRRTLEAMAHGGIHDQLGGGFHRYATDAGWRVPHFEKMLYDQAQLAVAYLEAWQATGDGAFATVVRSTCDYVLRDLTSPEGLFYCAQDADSLAPGALADSEAREGAFYLW